MSHLQGNSFQLLATKAFPSDAENSGIIKDAIQRAQQGIGLLEVFLPLGRRLIARKDKIVGPFLVVTVVNHVEEQALNIPALGNRPSGN